jgi:uncharacterized membrane protein
MRALVALPYLLAGLAVTAVTHLVTILLIPMVAPADATQRLLPGMEPNRLEIIAPVSADAMPLPFSDPAIQLAACRFDITQAPVLIRLRAGDSFASLILLGQDGRVLYSLTDRAAVRGTLDIRLLTRPQLERLEAADPDGEPVQEIRLTPGEPSGLAVFRAMIPWPSLVAEAEATLSNARCAPQPLAE